MLHNSRADKEHKGFGSSHDDAQPSPLHRPEKRFDPLRVRASGPVDRELAPNVPRVCRPETYLRPEYTQEQADLVRERIAALGLTDEQLIKLGSGIRMPFSTILGTDRHITRVELLSLGKHTIQSIMRYCRDHRDLSIQEVDRYEKLRAEAVGEIQKEKYSFYINYNQNEIPRLEAFERSCEMVVQCLKASNAVFLQTDETHASVFRDLKTSISDLKAKNKILRAENSELNLQLDELDAELARYRASIQPILDAFGNQEKNEPDAEGDSVDLNTWLSAIGDLCKETPDVSVHSAGACGSMVLHFLRARQSEDPLFWGTHGDHADPEVQGHFRQTDVVKYITDKCLSDDPEWELALNDLDLRPSGKTTYLSDRVSHALSTLVRAGVLKRNCIGGRTLWAASYMDAAA